MELQKDFYTYEDGFEGLSPGDVQEAEGTRSEDNRCTALGPIGTVCTLAEGHEGPHVAHTDDKTDHGYEVMAIYKADYEPTEKDRKLRRDMEMSFIFEILGF